MPSHLGSIWPRAPKGLTLVPVLLQMACKTIANLVTRAGISDLTGLQGGINVQGEEQKKLDVISNNVLKVRQRASRDDGHGHGEEDQMMMATMTPMTPMPKLMVWCAVRTRCGTRASWAWWRRRRKRPRSSSRRPTTPSETQSVC
jgi:hypothetical protein